MSEQREAIAVSDMTPAQVEAVLKDMPRYMPKPKFRLYRRDARQGCPTYCVAVEAHDPYGWSRSFGDVTWDGFYYDNPAEEVEATRQALQNCLDALGINRTEFNLPVKGRARVPLVAIRDLAEAQAQAWVAGPFSAECGRECELKVWVEDNACFAAVYVDGEPGEFFCGPDGDLSQDIRDAVARQAVGSLVRDCDQGPGGSYVYAALVPGEEATPEALLRHAFDYLVSTHCPDGLEGCDVTDGEQCENCWRKHLTWWARGAKEATTGAHEADRRA